MVGTTISHNKTLEKIGEGGMGEPTEIARGFVGEIKEMQDAFIERLGKDQTCAAWIDTEHLNPHARLLQLLEGLSLSLCSALIPPRYDQV